MRFYHTTARNALILEWDAHLEILESPITDIANARSGALRCPPRTLLRPTAAISTGNAQSEIMGVMLAGKPIARTR